MKLNIKQFLKFAFICLNLALLSSCSFLSPVKIDQSTYVLNSLPDYVPHRQTHTATILVLTPDSSPVYNTTRMAYTVRPYQVAYFSQNQWAETPSQMLHPLLIQTLQNTHYFHAVVTPPYAGRYDYVLSTQILKLQQDYTRRPAVVELVIRVQLSRGLTNQVIATQLFSVNERIHRCTPYSGVVAANRATARILQEIAQFCLARMP